MCRGVFLAVCVSVHQVHTVSLEARKGHRIPWDWSYKCLWGVMNWIHVHWRAACPPHHWAISPALDIYIYKIWFDAGEFVFIKMIYACCKKNKSEPGLKRWTVPPSSFCQSQPGLWVFAHWWFSITTNKGSHAVNQCISSRPLHLLPTNQ